MKAVLFFVLVVKLTVEADRCGVVPITEWDGEASLRYERLLLPVKLLVIQHTATPACLTDDQCRTVASGIRTYQRVEKGFTDIGQSFLIGGNGKVYEGAGWARVGAHTRNYNNRSLGITFIGNYMNKVPTSQALQAALDLISCGVRNQYIAEDYHVVNHNQLSRTLSPGLALQNEIQVWPHWTRDVNNL